MDEPKLERLSKIMAARGICSRREADSYIEKGWVLVDGEVVDQLGTKVSAYVEIELSPEAAIRQERRATILFNKPLGIVSAQAEEGYTPAVALIQPESQDPQFRGAPLKPHHLKGLAVAGRLDINSKGLLVLTQDGRVARQLVGENGELEKEYLVRVNRLPNKEELALLREGLTLDGKKLRRAHVEVMNENQLRFILKEGRKRQIRRMLEAVEIEVRALKRVRVGRIKLGKLQEGHWRWLTKEERF